MAPDSSEPRVLTTRREIARTLKQGFQARYQLLGIF